MEPPEPSAPPSEYYFVDKNNKTIKDIFPEKRCYHFFNGTRCERSHYDRTVKYPFCQEHRYLYARMEGLIDFLTIPLTHEQEDYLLNNLEKVKDDFEFELKQYKRFRPTGAEKKNEVFESILDRQKENLDSMPIVRTYEQYHNMRSVIYVPSVIQPDRRLPKIHEDRQSVHREDVRLAQNPMLFDLLRTNIHGTKTKTLLTQLNNTLVELYKEEGNKFVNIFRTVFKSTFNPTVSFFFRTLKSNMDQQEEFSYLDSATNIITRFRYSELANKIMYRIQQSRNRKELARRFMQEVNEGVGACMVGKITRMLNTFTGFDDFIQADQRTKTEKIQDAMAEIARLEGVSVYDKKSRARESLIRLGVFTNEEQAPWIDAFDE
jgi:hypothetical protein